jgi:Na+-transporting NADH:ubiquinone oxidoreductase subunit A
MGRHRIKRGLDVPIVGAPEQRIEDAPAPGRVAIFGADYPSMKPTMQVQPGDKVSRGQLLFEDKKQPGVRHTSPGSGTVQAINRGDKRAFQSLVVRLDVGERGGRGDQVSFSSYGGGHPGSLSRDQVAELLLESGLWTALRARPFGRVADPEQRPRSIFVNAMATDPLAPDMDLVYEGRESDFERGLIALGKLTEGPVYVCRGVGSRVDAPREGDFRIEEFSGPHPAGTVGVHIHTLDPVNRSKLVWYVGLQDVIAIGKLFATGELAVDRVVSLGGPVVTRPRLLRTRVGASLDDLAEGELAPGENRVISGSVLSGRTAAGEVHGYLGRYHQQVSALAEGRERQLLHWLAPGTDKFSVTNLFLAKLLPGKRFAMTTTTNGSPRAIVPIGLYEKVNPIDVPHQFLLKALVMRDLERAEELGCLELEEEDLALCTFVCPGKIDYGDHLRATLAQIEKEG